MKRKAVFFSLVILISGIVYKATLCPTVEFIDSGELALACKNLGIAHPTGYPLYTILGKLAWLIFPGDLIACVNLLSLLFTAFAIGFLFLLIAEALRVFGEGIMAEIIAAISALFTAFSAIWWSQGTTNEVYSLNLLLMAASIWSLLKGSDSDSNRWFILSFYLLGLCLANHLSAVYLIPGYLYILIAGIRKSRSKFRKLSTVLFFLALPLTLYLFLPIRAGFRPFLNWGGVNGIYFLYKHISGWQYRIWMFDKPLENIVGNFIPAAKLIIAQFGWVGTGLILLGSIVIARRNKRLLIFVIISCLLNLIYVLNYDIGDIESYYLPLILISTPLMGAGIYYLYSVVNRIRGSGILRVVVSGVLLLALPVSAISKNLFQCDRSQKTFARQGVVDLVSSAPNGGLAFVENWDFYSPWLYMHFEENFRPDFILLDKELMRRSWYIDFIRRNHADIYNRSRAAFEEFLRQVNAFERGRQYDPDIIDRAYYGMLQAVIKHESAIGAVYTNIISDKKFVAGYALAPDGVLLRFETSNQYLERLYFQFNEKYWGNRFSYADKRVAYLLLFYARAFDARREYCRYFGMTDEMNYYAELVGKVRGIITNIK